MSALCARGHVIAADGGRCDVCSSGHSTQRAAPDNGTRPTVDLAGLLGSARGFVRQYVVLSDAQADAIALWIAHTHAVDAADATPYLNISSVEKRSGKTLLLETLDLLVAKPWLTGRITPAVLYRKTDQEAPTLLLDESDAAFKGEKDYAEALRGILNTGHRRNGKTSACVGQGANISYQDFSTFGPKAIAGIGKLPGTIADRAIPITMKRRARSETVARFRWRDAREQADPLRDDLEAWGAASIEVLRGARPDLPDGLDDRSQDSWEPLLAIADMAGGEWSPRARAAAVVLSVKDSDDDSLGVRLLADTRATFNEKDVTRMGSGELVAALVAEETAPWGDLKGRPLDARALARLLRRYEIKPRVMRMGNATPRGYERQDFEDAWERYLACPPPIPEISATSATSATKLTPRLNLEPGNVADVADVAVYTGMGEGGAVDPDGFPDDAIPDDGRRLAAFSVALGQGWPAVHLGEREVNGKKVSVGVPPGRFAWQQVVQHWVDDDLIAELVVKLEEMGSGRG